MAHYRMYIDDTRDVENAATNDPKRRFASITGVVVEKDYYNSQLAPRFAAMKETHFGLTRKSRPPILHRHDVMAKKGCFACLEDPARERAWNDHCLRLYRQADYRVITASVDKIGFYFKYPKWNEDIYFLLVKTLLERYFFFLQSECATGDVLAEQRGKSDKRLKLKFRETLDNGTGYITAADLNKCITSKEIKIKPESDDIAGLQLADLLAATSFSHCQKIYANGRGPLGFSQEVANILETTKYHRDKRGNPDKFGRVWRP